MTSESDQRLISWVRDGPSNTDGWWVSVVAMVLWWRTWALMIAYSVAAMISIAAVDRFGSGAVPFVLLVGYLLCDWGILDAE